MKNIPIDWLDFQIDFAKKEGFNRSADAFEFVKKCWEETQKAWMEQQSSHPVHSVRHS